MLSAGRLPLNEAEHQAAEKLIADHAGKSASLTREGETLQVQIGDDIWHIGSDGKRRKQKGS